MELYKQVAFDTSRLATNRYSTSFSLACKLFPPATRCDIYGVYGLVRLADEIVDTYRGQDQLQILDDLEVDTYKSLKTGYSSNLMVHAFVDVAIRNSIDKQLIKPFFESMRQDIGHSTYSQKELDAYVYGSAEVVGLMCLRIFLRGDKTRYNELKPGAQALGAAFQKVNFLRDLRADHDVLGRVYFPEVDWKNFNDSAKREIEAGIARDFEQAAVAITQLPAGARPAVTAAYHYYLKLLAQIQKTPASQLKTRRVRVAYGYKLWILFVAWCGGLLSRGAGRG